jgi:hypothetical protein
LNDPPTASSDIDFSLQGVVAAVPAASSFVFGAVVAGALVLSGLFAGKRA